MKNLGIGHWKATGWMDSKISISNCLPLGEGFQGLGPQVPLQHTEISPGTNSEVIWLELKGFSKFCSVAEVESEVKNVEILHLKAKI